MIAIVGILALLVFPAISRVKNSGRMAQTVSDMRQIGMAMALYAESNNGQLPSAEGYFIDYVAKNNGNSLANKILPYLGDGSSAATGRDVVVDILVSPALRNHSPDIANRQSNTFSYVANRGLELHRMRPGYARPPLGHSSLSDDRREALTQGEAQEYIDLWLLAEYDHSWSAYPASWVSTPANVIQNPPYNVRLLLYADGRIEGKTTTPEADNQDYNKKTRNAL